MNFQMLLKGALGMMPKEMLPEGVKGICQSLTDWMRAKKLNVPLQKDERELTLQIIEHDNQLLMVPVILKDGPDGKDIINRALIEHGINITGMLQYIPYADVLADFMDNDAKSVRGQQHLLQLLRNAANQNRVAIAEPEPPVGEVTVHTAATDDNAGEIPQPEAQEEFKAHPGANWKQAAQPKPEEGTE